MAIMIDAESARWQSEEIESQAQERELRHSTGEKATFSDQQWLLFGEKPDFPGDFRRPNLTMWENLGPKFSTGVDYIGLKNNLQGFEGNLYPQGV